MTSHLKCRSHCSRFDQYLYKRWYRHCDIWILHQYVLSLSDCAGITKSAMWLISDFFFFLMIWTSLSEDPQEVITVKQGEDVTLQCWGFADAPIELLEWRRPELKPDYVFYYREQRSYEMFQHSSFKGRVKLRDPEMKNGDFSVILKEVTFNDTGRYECLVGTRRTRRTRDERSSISVRVEQTTKDTSGGGNTEREKWHVPQIAAIVITVFVPTVLILLIGVVVVVQGPY